MIPAAGRYGVAWNAARGTALGHTFMMTCADFGQPIIDLPGGRRVRCRGAWRNGPTARRSYTERRWLLPNT
jgi:hypothetical protein